MATSLAKDGVSAPRQLTRLRGCGKLTRRAKFRWSRRANQRYQLAPSFPGKRGGRASSRTWGKDAVDAAASARNGIAGRTSVRERFTARRTNDAKAYGKTVWSWHPLLVSSRRRFFGPDRARKTLDPPTTVTRRIRRRGERGISR